jgi:hypothetical protein
MGLVPVMEGQVFVKPLPTGRSGGADELEFFSFFFFLFCYTNEEKFIAEK